ncbi:hypothetical protein BVI434_3860005 [Burkholderia vietnamiensis]|nr:hypothetical protein BVI434_3860005 [Burkholderia vietnamiensis]
MLYDGEICLGGGIIEHAASGRDVPAAAAALAEAR